MSDQLQLDLDPPRTYATPRWRDYHVVGSRWGGLRSALYAHWLYARTQRLLAGKGAARAGKHLAEASRKNLVGVEVECDRVGLHWRLAPSDLAQRVMFAGGSFEHPLVAWIVAQLRAGDRVADVGAHVGLFTTQFAKRLHELGGGSVVSFEPAPDSAARVRAHVEMNGLTDYVTVVQAAVAAEPGRGALRAIEPSAVDDPSLRSLFGGGDTVAADVEVIRFDDWWTSAGRPAVDVVKIDVEGGEFGVIEGMAETLRAARPRLVVVEIKEHISAKAGVAAEDVVARLGDLGYDNRGPFSKVIGHAPMRYLDDNFVFVPQARRGASSAASAPERVRANS